MKNLIYNSLFPYQKYGLKLAYGVDSKEEKMMEDLDLCEKYWYNRLFPHQSVLTHLQALGLELDDVGNIERFWGKQEVKPKIKNLLKTSKSVDIRWCWFDDLKDKNKCTWIDIEGYGYDAIQKPRIIRKKEIKKLILKTFNEKVKDETKVIVFEHLGVIHVSFMENQTCLVIISFFLKKRGV